MIDTCVSQSVVQRVHLSHLICDLANRDVYVAVCKTGPTVKMSSTPGQDSVPARPPPEVVCPIRYHSAFLFTDIDFMLIPGVNAIYSIRAVKRGFDDNFLWIHQNKKLQLSHDTVT